MAVRVLLVGWDAADWRMIQPLLEAGELPVLARLVERGVMGNLASQAPMISPMLWTTIATGRRPFDHGICGFVEPADAGGVQPASSFSRRVKAVWNILAQNGLRAGVVNWLAGHPVEPLPGGFGVSPEFFAAAGSPPAGSVHPAALAESLAELRILPDEITGDILQPFVPRAGEIDQGDPVARRPLEILARTLAHCAGVHATATWLLEHESWDFAAVYYEAIDHAGHAFMPFHPPRMPGIDPRLFERFRGVMDGIYRFHDMMLGRLLELAGDDAVVLLVSDHGFYSNHLRPGARGESLTPNPVAWHRPHGVLAMAGPGVLADERVYGATILDITPTILALFGLPCGSDMPGRPLVEALTGPVLRPRVASWEAVPGPSGTHSPDTRAEPLEAREIVRRLVDLGYLDEPVDSARAAEAAGRDWKFNLAVSWLEAGRPSEAVRLLETVAGTDPRGLVVLARARLAAGDVAGARLAAESARMPEDAPERHLLFGQILLAEGRPRLALSRLRQAEKAAPRLPRIPNQIGAIHLKLRRWRSAARSFRRALAIDPESAAAWEGLAGALLRLGNPQEASEAALRAVGLQHFLPAAHLHLGRALLRQGDAARGLLAVERAAAMRPAARVLRRYADILSSRLAA